jgi:hypothetical protein
MKPGDFLIGVLDLFAILLPGSLATWLVTQYIDPKALRAALQFGIGDAQNLNPWVVGAAFVLSSYMLGHFVFQGGSKLDPIYDAWRKRTKPDDANRPFKAARDLQAKLTADLAKTYTPFKWAKAYIQIKAPAARIEIDRLEADSKFFRSMIVVSAAFFLHFLVRETSWVAAGAALFLGWLSFIRYRDQRWKMTELTYATAVIAHAAGPATTTSPVA